MTKTSEKAHAGLLLMKEAILEVIATNPDGLRNADIAAKLDIHSDYRGGQKDYLSWSILGLLLKEKKVTRKGRKYFLSDENA